MNFEKIALFVTILCLSILIGCNKVVDVQEPDTETVPEATITAIKNDYPNAEKFVFKTLLKDKLWKAKFVSNASNFETQVSPTAIVAQVYRESSDITLYKDLTDKLKVRGGAISGVQLADKATDNGARMKYVFNGKPFLLDYYILNDWHIIKLTSKAPSESIALEVVDLPDNIQSFCQQKAISLTNATINLITDSEGKKAYYIYPVAQLYPVIFNEAGELLWIARNSNGSNVVNKPNNEVGNAELLAKVSEGYEDFTTPTAVAFEAQFDSLKSIRYVFQKKSGVEGTRTFINELREVFVNAATGEIIYDQYSSYVFR
ncbi:hypothetical protein [Dyadobacter sp. BHUBP1]|uniref:hypothetical protein n=1 Tax=Dyadobacter sp. BHUBP1 TaxID=3424178 RepID=UPI003D34E3F5